MIAGRLSGKINHDPLSGGLRLSFRVREDGMLTLTLKQATHSFLDLKLVVPWDYL
jgi:hypothetical protein